MKRRVCKDMRGHLWNAFFKVHRYEPDYPGLAGRDLTPKGVIELPASRKGSALPALDLPSVHLAQMQHLSLLG